MTYKAGLELAQQVKGTLGIDVAEKQSPMANLGSVLPLVEMDPKAQVPVYAAYGESASQCTIDIIRHPLNSICCGKWGELGKCVHATRSLNVH
jgi:hypothetical protein